MAAAGLAGRSRDRRSCPRLAGTAVSGVAGDAIGVVDGDLGAVGDVEDVSRLVARGQLAVDDSARRSAWARRRWGRRRGPAGCRRSRWSDRWTRTGSPPPGHGLQRVVARRVSLACLSDAADGGNGHEHEDEDDGDDDQQFHQREAVGQDEAVGWRRVRLRRRRLWEPLRSVESEDLRFMGFQCLVEQAGGSRPIRQNATTYRREREMGRSERDQGSGIRAE